VISACCLVVLTTLCAAAEAAHARSEAIARAVDHCATQGPNPEGQAGRLSEDGSILCFDGAIDDKLELAPLLKLQDSGFFVVRSVGGYGSTAMQIASGLFEKNATVVIRDYCLSACANYIFVATNQTYVLGNAIVAWHGGIADCADAETAAALRRIYRPCSSFYLVNSSREFFAKRGIGPRYTFMPPTRYTKQMSYVALQGAAEKRSVFWMWHPKNHGDYFKGRITYESYPDEDAVYTFMRRSRGHGRIIYDPAE
jgi:hypothetical protein